MTKTFNDFDVFLTHFKTGRPQRYADWITIKVWGGTADKVEKDANRVISEQGLNLVAIATIFSKKDSVCVQVGDRET